MAGTKEGGAKAAATNKALYGKDFYGRIGSEGGKRGKTGGFWHAKYILGDNEHARAAGRKGGKISKRRRNNV